MHHRVIWICVIAILQVWKTIITNCLFAVPVYSEPCHYNPSIVSTMPYSTYPTTLGPHTCYINLVWAKMPQDTACGAYMWSSLIPLSFPTRRTPGHLFTASTTVPLTRLRLGWAYGPSLDVCSPCPASSGTDDCGAASTEPGCNKDSIAAESAAPEISDAARETTSATRPSTATADGDTHTMLISAHNDLLSNSSNVSSNFVFSFCMPC
jgi:hypothetical protein